jgi:hypothetical protein
LIFIILCEMLKNFNKNIIRKSKVERLYRQRGFIVVGMGFKPIPTTTVAEK